MTLLPRPFYWIVNWGTCKIRGFDLEIGDHHEATSKERLLGSDASYLDIVEFCQP